MFAAVEHKEAVVRVNVAICWIRAEGWSEGATPMFEPADVPW